MRALTGHSEVQRGTYFVHIRPKLVIRRIVDVGDLEIGTDLVVTVLQFCRACVRLNGLCLIALYMKKKDL